MEKDNPADKINVLPELTYIHYTIYTLEAISMEAGISSIRFTGRQDLQYQEQAQNGVQKPVSTKSSELRESSVVKLIRMMGIGQNVDTSV